jgi:hypothetical protein
MRGKMEFKRILQYLLMTLIPVYLVTGCGDLEPKMQDTRTVILKMDFDQRSSSRTSRLDEDELNDLINYQTHLIMVLTSENIELTPGDYLSNSNYLDYRSNNKVEEYVLYDSDRTITLNMKLNTKMKIFAFLFREKYSIDSIGGDQDDNLFSVNRVAGYYGESDIITIEDLTSIPANIILKGGSGDFEGGEGDFEGGEGDFEGGEGGFEGGEGDFEGGEGGFEDGTDTGTDTTVPTASVTTVTITSSDNATVRSTETGTAYLVKTTVSVSNNFNSITGAADSQWNSVPIILAICQLRNLRTVPTKFMQRTPHTTSPAHRATA